MSQSKFGEACAEVTVKLFDKLKAGDGKENVLISPISIQTCMALAFSGAKGDTANEIATAMGYSSKCPSEVAESFHGVLNQYEGSDLVKIANKVYVQEGKSLKPDYLTMTKEKYHAEAENVNFAENKLAAKTMNNWVEQKTKGKIVNLISPDALKDDTRFVLLNALHFKGQWVEKFNPARTKPSEFWITKDQSVNVDYMCQQEEFHFAYNEQLKCNALEMPYANSDLSMFVIMPHEQDGLKELAQKLRDVNLFDLAKGMEKMDVFVKLPKFKIEYSIEMSDALKEMGITKAFRDDADFSNILQSAEDISISKVLHKASIDVNEEGSEAAAATAMIPKVRCMPPVFDANHPFFYFIWNKKNVILFAGAFVKPPQKA